MTYFQDNRVLSGDISGSIKLWDMKSNESIAQTDKILTSPIHMIKICNKYPNNMICSRNDGSIQVYDIHNSCSMLRNMQIYTPNTNTNTNGIVGLSLSPRNSKLLTTISGDGTISLIDTSAGGNTINPQQYRPSAIINPNTSGASGTSQSKPTSISCHENGFHFAVVTTDGNMVIYDWRHATEPVCRYTVSPGVAIHNIEFQVSVCIYVCA